MNKTDVDEIREKLDALRVDVDRISAVGADINDIKLLMMRQQKQRYLKPRRYFCCYTQDTIDDTTEGKSESILDSSDKTEQNTILNSISRNMLRRKGKNPRSMPRRKRKVSKRRMPESVPSIMTLSFSSRGELSEYDSEFYPSSPISSLSMSSGFCGDGGSSVSEPSLETPHKSVRFSM